MSGEHKEWGRYPFAQLYFADELWWLWRKPTDPDAFLVDNLRDNRQTLVRHHITEPRYFHLREDLQREAEQIVQKAIDKQADEPAQGSTDSCQTEK
jgi:hypothetical protein